MSIEEVLAEWEKTKYAAEVALEDAKQRRLESAKARALQEAEEIMGLLQTLFQSLMQVLLQKIYCRIST